MGYIVKNPYGQPAGAPVLTGVRRPDVDGVNKDWFEGEIIPEEILSERQITTWISQGVLEPEETSNVSPGLLGSIRSRLGI